MRWTFPLSPILLLLILLSATSAAAAQDPSNPFDPRNFDPAMLGRNQDAPVFFDSRDRVRTSVTPAALRVRPGADVPIAVVFDIDYGWHTWTNKRSLPDGLTLWSSAITTEIITEHSAPDVFEIHDRFTHWPEVHGIDADFGDGPQTFAVFEGRATAYLPVSIRDDAPEGEHTLTIKLTFQSCDDTTCLAPVFEQEFNVRLIVANDAEPVSLAANDFSDFPGDLFERIRSGAAVVTLPSDAAQPDAVTTASSTGSPMFFGFELPRADGLLGLILLALFSALGGLILNFTPCVLPVIPIKIMTILQHANKPGKNLVLGLSMAIGVIAFWVAAGLPVVIFRSAADPSRIFGIWWFTIGVGIVIALMGAGIMGLFMIQLPQKIYLVNPRADTVWGSFVFGIMTAVLGLPCFGFVAGALLVGAAALPAMTIMLIFFCLGVGMAAPYFILSAFPSLVDRMPRTGPASELIKQVMGLMLFAAAAYFIGAGLIGLVNQYPYMAKQLHWWAAVLLIVAGALWMIFRTFQITSRPAPRVVFSLVGLLTGVAALGYAMNSTGTARTNWIEYEAAIAATGGRTLFAPGVWNTYTPAAFKQAREEGHIVLLDFTAEWCINCKALKAAVLNPDPVRSELRRPDVVSFTVDLTNLRDPGWDFLRELGHTGIPVLAIFTPGRESPWLSTAYTSQQVMDALAEARSHAVASR